MMEEECGKGSNVNNDKEGLCDVKINCNPHARKQGQHCKALIYRKKAVGETCTDEGHVYGMRLWISSWVIGWSRKCLYYQAHNYLIHFVLMKSVRWLG